METETDTDDVLWGGTGLTSSLPSCEEKCEHREYCNGATSSGDKNPILRYVFDDGWLQLRCLSFEFPAVKTEGGQERELCDKCRYVGSDCEGDDMDYPQCFVPPIPIRGK